jgi:hypothetical protein
MIVPTINGIPQPNVPQTDMMANLLTEIFGEGWATMNFDGTSSAGEAGYNMLYPMLTHMNQIALTLVTILVFVTMITGTVGTAQEGKPLGKRFNEMWVPARMLIGVTGLAPVAQGLCIFQLLILWGAGWSIDFANQMAGQAVSYLSSSRGQIITTMPTSMREDAHTMAESSLRTAIVQAYFHNKVEDCQYPNGQNVLHVGNAKSLGPEKGYVVRLQFVAPPNSDLTDEDMGAIYVYGKTPDDPIMWSKAYAAESVHANMLTVATEIVNVQPVKFNAIDRAIAEYQQRLKPSMGQIIADSNQELDNYVQNFGSALTENGWISMGMYHWTIVRMHEKAMDTVMTGSPSFIEPSWNKIRHCAPAELSIYLNDNWAYYCEKAKSYKQDALDKAKDIAAGDDNPFTKTFNALYRDISLPWVVHTLTDGGPVVAMSNLGHKMIVGITGAVVTYTALRSSLASGIEAMEGTAPGKLIRWAGGNIVTKGAFEALKVAGGLLLLCVIPIYILAFTMAFYLPSLPMIIWISGCIGWILQVIEALVAAPVWVAAHTHPDGDGLTGKFGGHGYIRLLAIILKPALLVIGFCTALLLEHMIGPYLAKALLVADASINGDKFNGPFTLIAMTFICGLVVLIMTHKIFSLCVYLPDHVLDWVGGRADALGEMEAERHAASSYGAVGTKAEGAIQGTFGRGTASSPSSPGANAKPSDFI